MNDPQRGGGSAKPTGQIPTIWEVLAHQTLYADDEEKARDAGKLLAQKVLDAAAERRPKR